MWYHWYVIKRSRWFTEPSYMCNVVWDRRTRRYSLTTVNIVSWHCNVDVQTFPPSHTLTFRIHPDCIQMILFTFSIILLTIYSILHHYNTVSIHLSLYTIVGITKTNTNNLPQGQGSVHVGVIHFMDLISLWNCHLTTKLFFIRRTS